MNMNKEIKKYCIKCKKPMLIKQYDKSNNLYAQCNNCKITVEWINALCNPSER